MDRKRVAGRDLGETRGHRSKKMYRRLTARARSERLSFFALMSSLDPDAHALSPESCKLKGRVVKPCRTRVSTK